MGSEFGAWLTALHWTQFPDLGFKVGADLMVSGESPVVTR